MARAWAWAVISCADVKSKDGAFSQLRKCKEPGIARPDMASNPSTPLRVCMNGCGRDWRTPLYPMPDRGRRSHRPLSVSQCRGPWPSVLGHAPIVVSSGPRPGFDVGSFPRNLSPRRGPAWMQVEAGGLKGPESCQNSPGNIPSPDLLRINYTRGVLPYQIDSPLII